MLTIWGRHNSVNVQKVLWCCAELNLQFHRIDAGLEFGLNGEPAYLALNPNGRVPTLVDDDFVLWESNSIIRYLAMQYGENETALYPQAPKLRASIDRWLDWTLSTLQPAERPVFWGFVRTPAHERNYSISRPRPARWPNFGQFSISISIGDHLWRAKLFPSPILSWQRMHVVGSVSRT